MKEQIHKRPMSLYRRPKCGIRSPGSEIASGTFLEVSCSCPPLNFLLLSAVFYLAQATFDVLWPRISLKISLVL